MPEAVIIDALRPHRTWAPRLHPSDVGCADHQSIVERNNLDPPDRRGLSGCQPGGEDNRNVARMAALLAGLPVSVPQ